MKEMDTETMVPTKQKNGYGFDTTSCLMLSYFHCQQKILIHFKIIFSWPNLNKLFDELPSVEGKFTFTFFTHSPPLHVGYPTDLSTLLTPSRWRCYTYTANRISFKSNFLLYITFLAVRCYSRFALHNYYLLIAA